MEDKMSHFRFIPASNQYNLQEKKERNLNKKKKIYNIYITSLYIYIKCKYVNIYIYIFFLNIFVV